MDGYSDSPFRQVCKSVAPNIIAFSEFYSADGLVHSKTLAPQVLPHHASEKPLIIQIFGKDPEMFAKAAQIIESYGVAGVDINMGCPAKKVVRSGHGSSLMIHRDTAFRIVEAMAKVVSIPVSVKTRLGWNNYENLIEFCTGLQNSGASLITVHGRTYEQAFTGQANWEGIYELKKNLHIPVIGNGDVLNYDDGVAKQKNLDGFMIGRACFGNPWCFLPGNIRPTLGQVLDMMHFHAETLIAVKGRKGTLEIRKHLVRYVLGLVGASSYRKALVTIEGMEDVDAILATIQREHTHELDLPIGGDPRAHLAGWEGCPV